MQCEALTLDKNQELLVHITRPVTCFEHIICAYYAG